MSELLQRTKTGRKRGDAIVAKVNPGEQVLFALEGVATIQPGGMKPVGAILVTTSRVLVAEAKLLGGVSISALDLSEVTGSGLGHPNIALVNGLTKTWQVWCKNPDDIKLFLASVDEARRLSEKASNARLEGQMEEIRRQRGV